jgi:hypothetical protein
MTSETAFAVDFVLKESYEAFVCSDVEVFDGSFVIIVRNRSFPSTLGTG